MPAKFKLAIVGGGIGGLSLAAGLLHRQENANNFVEINVYESASKFAEIGAGVSFGPNAVQAMSLIHPKIIEKYEKISDYRKRWFQWRRGDEMETELGSSEPSFVHKYMGESGVSEGFVDTTAHRAQFLDLLASILPQNSERFSSHFGKRLVNYIQESYGNSECGIKLEFADGTTESCDVLIGYDGVKSVTRKLMFGSDRKFERYSGTHAYRAVIPMDTAIEAVGEEQATNGQMYIGKDKHIVTFPICGGKIFNMVAFKSDRSKPIGQRVWSPNGSKEQADWVVPVPVQEVKNDFSDFGAGVHRLLDHIQNPSRWAIHELVELPTYINKNLALAGDAAHCNLPHVGQGAGSSLEDSLILSTILGDPRSNKSNIQQILFAYDQVRRPRASGIQATSREYGEAYEYAKYHRGQDEELKQFLAHGTNWIWEHDLKNDCDRALDIAYSV